MKDTYEFVDNAQYADEYLADVKKEIIGLKLHHKQYGECEIVDACIRPYTPEGSIDKLVLGLQFGDVNKMFLASIFLKFCDADAEETNIVAMCDAMFYDLAKARHDSILSSGLRELEIRLLKERQAQEEKQKKDKEKHKAERAKKKKEKNPNNEEAEEE